jgi:hypothetical protein
MPKPPKFLSVALKLPTITSKILYPLFCKVVHYSCESSAVMVKLHRVMIKSSNIIAILHIYCEDAKLLIVVVKLSTHFIKLPNVVSKQLTLLISKLSTAVVKLLKMRYPWSALLYGRKICEHHQSGDSNLGGQHALPLLTNRSGMVSWVRSMVGSCVCRYF